MTIPACRHPSRGVAESGQAPPPFARAPLKGVRKDADTPFTDRALTPGRPTERTAGRLKPKETDLAKKLRQDPTRSGFGKTRGHTFPPKADMVQRDRDVRFVP
jgi:hypothetical protein